LVGSKCSLIVRGVVLLRRRRIRILWWIWRKRRNYSDRKTSCWVWSKER